MLTNSTTMRALILFTLISAAFAALEPVTKPTQMRSVNRIVGGSNTTIQTYPFMSNMQWIAGGIIWLSWCGGSLITPSTILSAAHCYYKHDPTQWRVRLGSTFASSGGVLQSVLRFHLHEDYDDHMLLNDVAIVTMTTRATLSEYIGIARIAGPNYHLPDGTELTAVGWGYTDNFDEAETLQHVNLNIINQQLCADRYAYKTQPSYELWPNITDGMLCAGILDVGGKGTCVFDEGGPLVHQSDIIVGVIGYSYNCGHDFYPSVSSRVSYYANWIFANGAG